MPTIQTRNLIICKQIQNFSAFFNPGGLVGRLDPLNIWWSRPCMLSGICNNDMANNIELQGPWTKFDKGKWEAISLINKSFSILGKYSWISCSVHVGTYWDKMKCCASFWIHTKIMNGTKSDTPEKCIVRFASHIKLHSLEGSSVWPEYRSNYNSKVWIQLPPKRKNNLIQILNRQLKFVLAFLSLLHTPVDYFLVCLRKRSPITTPRYIILSMINRFNLYICISQNDTHVGDCIILLGL